jgi:hypothetical protein
MTEQESTTPELMPLNAFYKIWHTRIAHAQTIEHRKDVLELFTFHFLARIAAFDDPRRMREELRCAREVTGSLTYSHRHSLVGFFPQAVAATEVVLQRPWKQEDAPSW